ncbi:hypothetical protein HY991_04880 [Candidatus Micrarchaeota archaeon]|nr:hypothetical protein [Candidatus Micrarchaeota archaeon]
MVRLFRPISRETVRRAYSTGIRRGIALGSAAGFIGGALVSGLSINAVNVASRNHEIRQVATQVEHLSGIKLKHAADWGIIKSVYKFSDAEVRALNSISGGLPPYRVIKTLAYHPTDEYHLTELYNLKRSAGQQKNLAEAQRVQRIIDLLSSVKQHPLGPRIHERISRTRGLDRIRGVFGD